MIITMSMTMIAFQTILVFVFHQDFLDLTGGFNFSSLSQVATSAQAYAITFFLQSSYTPTVMSCISNRAFSWIVFRLD